MRLVGLVRETLTGDARPGAVADVDREIDSAVGRYRYVRIQGVQYRVYYEEAGEGIPLVLQHTAGSDGRQWRHLLEDRELQRHFRMIAYDLPYHGKSLPPTGVAWWEQEYRLTTELVMDSVVEICRALDLERPVYMGCSVGGYLAPDLALYRPDEFRAVIGVNSGPGDGRGGPAPSLGLARQTNSYLGARMYSITSSTAPEPYRRETGWVYSQGGPDVFAGDLYYYSVDHDLTGGKARGIDTSKIGVHFLTGEFDPTVAGPAGTEALVADIPGCTYDVIEGGSHFVMCDNYPLFRQYLVPVLDRIRG
ncbi:MAG: alpha/beta hydrolase [Acidobacteria bacterium]|nr:alpha/beta hydrolase [Acidobacteriota bacterium]MYI74459.1 alpha/beta hydrolase [Acidobacteriota bacterium]